VLSPCVLPLLPIIFGAAASAHRLGPVALAAGVVISFVAIGLLSRRLAFRMDGSVPSSRSAERSRRSRGTGRVANVDHIDLDAGKVQHDKGHIVVDNYLHSKSNLPSMFAAMCCHLHNRRLSPLMKAALSGATSSRVQSTSPITRASPLASARSWHFQREAEQIDQLLACVADDMRAEKRRPHRGCGRGEEA
jgi:hypothetical protein